MSERKISWRSEIVLRIVSAIVGGGLLILSIYLGPWYLFGAFLVIAVVSQWEFYRLLGVQGHLPLRYWGCLSGGTTVALVFLWQYEVIADRWLYVLFPLYATIFFIKLYKKLDTFPFRNIAYTLLGIIYVSIPFALLMVVAFSEGRYEMRLVMGTFFLLWACDSGAYFSGKMLGRRPLWSRISPKKSWEGAIGGILFSVGLSLALSHWWDFQPAWRWVGMALIISITGIYGDLVESLFKRSMSLKDSGRSIPGHGGFLDRFDGLLLSLPFLLAFLELF